MIITKSHPDHEYYHWHDEIFGKDINHRPAYVFFGHDENDNFIGFMSGYYHDRRTFYIQKIAINPELKSKKLATEFAIESWAYMKEQGVKYLLGQVEPANIPTMIVALKSGWVINGYFTDTNGKPFVRIIMDLGA